MPAPATVKKMFLVVDDDPGMRGLLVRLLKTDEAEITTCESGGEAIRNLQTHSFDVVLQDVGLPDMSGLDVLKAFAAKSPATRFLMITADDTPDTLIEAVRGRACGYLRKPFTPEQLRDAVDDCLSATDQPDIEVVSARPDWFELSLPCTRAAASRIDNFMQQFKLELPEEVRDTVAQAFRELLMNAVEWGGGLDPSRRVRVACLRTQRMLLYRIADPGPGFDLEDLQHAAIGQPDGDPMAHMAVREQKGIRPGGLGLMIVKAFADELLYNEQRNEVVFVKYLTA
ncbi:MAG: response regulator [Terriglobales bacterium]